MNIHTLNALFQSELNTNLHIADVLDFIESRYEQIQNCTGMLVPDRAEVIKLAVAEDEKDPFNYREMFGDQVLMMSFQHYELLNHIDWGAGGLGEPVRNWCEANRETKKFLVNFAEEELRDALQSVVDGELWS